jgi:hypothetical protein
VILTGLQSILAAHILTNNKNVNPKMGFVSYNGGTVRAPVGHTTQGRWPYW